MKKLLAQLNIAEKLFLSFGFVGLLFLGVIWQYHVTLQRALADHQTLQEVHGAKRGYALAIENSMLAARRAEKDFLLQRKELYAEEVATRVADVLDLAGSLERIDPQGAQTGRRIAQLIQTYHQRFEVIAEAWRNKGLDHDSGLQGAFRDSVHQLESLAAHFKVGGLYRQLLQIRRGEKDLGLRREAQYLDKVRGLLQEFEVRMAASELDGALKGQLQQELSSYREAFEAYARSVLSQQDIHGGKGPFRQAAHRIEALLAAHYIPDLERNILQLRRWEKDYLLRGERGHVDLALDELVGMHTQIGASAIAPEHKAKLEGLLSDYERDFLVLVEQNVKIDRLQAEMQEAVLKIVPIVRQNVSDADRSMQETTQQILTSSQADAGGVLWIAVAAVLLGMLSALTISLSIRRPLLRMAGVLGQLAYEQPVDRISAVTGGRDEVNFMAQSVNTIADHRARFIDWWKKSMREVESEQQLQEAAGESQQEQEAAADELRQAREEKEQLRQHTLGDIRAQVEDIVGNAERLLQLHPHGERYEDTRLVEQSGRSVLSLLEMLQPHDGPANRGVTKEHV
ncbi:MAG: hypothetical protein RPU64_06955 [Candidatus Sedimenticola sp. (ex Thyasira tokunagai)]